MQLKINKKYLKIGRMQPFAPCIILVMKGKKYEFIR